MSAPPADPLADVFPGTVDAPLPRWSGGRDHSRRLLLPARTDRRWAPQPPKETR